MEKKDQKQQIGCLSCIERIGRCIRHALFREEWNRIHFPLGLYRIALNTYKVFEYHTIGIGNGKIHTREIKARSRSGCVNTSQIKHPQYFH